MTTASKIRKAQSNSKMSLRCQKEADCRWTMGVCLSFVFSIRGKVEESEGTLTKTTDIMRLKDASLSTGAEGGLRAFSFVLHLLSEMSELVDFRQPAHPNSSSYSRAPTPKRLLLPENILLTRPRPFYYTYDPQSGISHPSPHRLSSTTFTDKCSTDTNESLQNFTLSPTGGVLAVADKRDHVYPADWKTSASGNQVIG